MMPVFLPQARAENPRNALLDFSPIGEAIDSNRRNALLQGQQDMQRQELDLSRQRLGLQQRQYDDAQKQQITQRFGALAQAVDAETDPAKRAALWQRVIGMHPGAKGLDPTYHDPMQGPKLLMAESGHFKDPLEQRYKEAQIAAISRQGTGLTDDQKEYEYAVRQGFKGSLLEFMQTKKSNIGTPAPKEYQTKDAIFSDRLARTNAIIDQVAGIDPNTGEPAKGAYNPARSANAWFPDDWNLVNSREWQQYQQAAREGIAAILRKDTGAAVTQTEWDLYFPMLYPQPGDGPEVVRQKRASRDAAFRGLKGSSGPAYDLMFPQELRAPGVGPQTAPAPAARPRARNPQTGEEVEFDGQTWVPVGNGRLNAVPGVVVQ